MEAEEKGGCRRAGRGHISYLGQAFAYRRETPQLATYALAARLEVNPQLLTIVIIC